jgi:hypothetical protein
MGVILPDEYRSSLQCNPRSSPPYTGYWSQFVMYLGVISHKPFITDIRGPIGVSLISTWHICQKQFMKEMSSEIQKKTSKRACSKRRRFIKTYMKRFQLTSSVQARRWWKAGGNSCTTADISKEFGSVTYTVNQRVYTNSGKCNKTATLASTEDNSFWQTLWRLLWSKTDLYKLVTSCR